LDYFSQVRPLIEALKLATENKDWDEVKTLDEQLRSQIEVWVKGVSTEEEKASLGTLLRKLETIIALVKDGAIKHRAQLQEELSRLNKEQKAVASYKRSGLL